MNGRDFPGQTRSSVGRDGWFPSPGFGTLMGSGPSRLLQAFYWQLEFLQRSGFVEAFSASSFWQANSMTFSPPLGLPGRSNVLIELPALSFHKATPGHPPAPQPRLPASQLVPLAFIRSRCLAGTPGDVHSTARMVERNPLLQGGWSLWSCVKALGCLCQPLAAVLGTRLPCPLLTLRTSEEELIAASFNR